MTIRSGFVPAAWWPCGLRDCNWSEVLSFDHSGEKKKKKKSNMFLDSVLEEDVEPLMLGHCG